MKMHRFNFFPDRERNANPMIRSGHGSNPMMSKE